MANLLAGQIVYWTKVVPQCEIFEVIPLKVHSIENDYFTGVDIAETKQTHLFSYNSLHTIVYTSKQAAEDSLATTRSEYFAHNAHRQFTKMMEDEG